MKPSEMGDIKDDRIKGKYLGKKTAHLLIFGQAVHTPAPFLHPLYHLLVFQMQTNQAVWASAGQPHCKSFAPVWILITVGVMLMHSISGAKVADESHQSLPNPVMLQLRWHIG